MRVGTKVALAVALVAGMCLAPSALAETMHFDLWDHETAYNGSHAQTTFQLDSSYTVLGGTLNLSAFNDDDVYWRVVKFYLGGEQGDGGPIGCYYWAPGQLQGEGVLKQNETKSWSYDLSNVMIADSSNIPPGYRYVNFIDIINDILQSSDKTPVDIEVEAWVTTSAAGSWVSASIDLEVEVPADDDTDDDVDDDTDDDIDDDADDDVVDDDVDDDTTDDDAATDDDTGGDDDDDDSEVSGCGC